MKQYERNRLTMFSDDLQHHKLAGRSRVHSIFFFKQKTAYEMCGRDWSSDVCSSDLKFGHVNPRIKHAEDNGMSGSRSKLYYLM